VLALGGATSVVRWNLPPFSLRMMVGAAANAYVAGASATKEALGPLQESLSGKRPRDDPAVEKLFNAKRRATTDKTLAKELRGRRWRPSQDLVETVVSRECWMSARALLALPELDEDFAVRLLAARPQLLPRVVRRAHNSRLLGASLCEHLTPERLREVLGVLRIWMDSYKEFPADVLITAAPDIPKPTEIVEFLSAIADGCLPSLVRLETEFIDQVLDGLASLQSDGVRTQKLYSTLRALLRPMQPLNNETLTTPTMEAMLLPL